MFEIRSPIVGTTTRAEAAKLGELPVGGQEIPWNDDSASISQTCLASLCLVFVWYFILIPPVFLWESNLIQIRFRNPFPVGRPTNPGNGPPGYFVILFAGAPWQRPRHSSKRSRREGCRSTGDGDSSLAILAKVSPNLFDTKQEKGKYWVKP